MFTKCFLIISMKKLSFIQLNRASEIIGNISVAWFSGGIIVPLFIPNINWIEYTTYFVVSLVMSIALFVISLNIIEKRVKKI